MSLASGRYWINPRREKDMPTKPITSHRIKDGKLVAKPPRMAAGQAKNRKLKTARLAKAWAERSK